MNEGDGPNEYAELRTDAGHPVNSTTGFVLADSDATLIPDSGDTRSAIAAMPVMMTPIARSR